MTDQKKSKYSVGDKTTSEPPVTILSTTQLTDEEKASIGKVPTGEAAEELNHGGLLTPHTDIPGQSNDDWEKDVASDTTSHALRQAAKDLPPELAAAIFSRPMMERPMSSNIPDSKEEEQKSTPEDYARKVKIAEDFNRTKAMERHYPLTPDQCSPVAVGTSQLAEPPIMFNGVQWGTPEYYTRWINDIIQNSKEDKGLVVETISDGYHTFKELYDFRLYLTAAWFYTIYYTHVTTGATIPVWRSKLHSDGTMYEGGWFVVGLGFAEGHQISFHYEEKHWDMFHFCRTLPKAPEWDGHTSQEVLKRIKKMIP